jgi:hypothetical protein
VRSVLPAQSPVVERLSAESFLFGFAIGLAIGIGIGVFAWLL